MEQQPTLVESLFESVEAYGKATLELSKLKALDTTTTILTSMFSRLIVIAFISLFVIVLSVGVALLLGEVLGKPYYGFFIVATFYLLGSIVSHFYIHTWIKRPLGDYIITRLLQ